MDNTLFDLVGAKREAAGAWSIISVLETRRCSFQSFSGIMGLKIAKTYVITRASRGLRQDV